ncbi:glycosyl hydrolase [Coprobacter tertius]|uniref:Glycosyl hydrolases family 2, sugar binding domain n=1 Tax=Coprobacter tertius TaxID=2944915 RepID=A0ABT1MEB7_9BACT|nr:glycosyl hydrolase [Coprobacter tertius]MCP9610962.1 hypothetical protein [Coprobacter tertius]
MKSKYLFFSCFISILPFLQSTAKKTNENPNNLNDLRKEFSTPGKQYGTIPFFVWNEKMTPPLIDRMMQSYKENGFGGVFIHPRVGLQTEYLSQEWYDLVKYTVNKGKELGLDVWLYDENSYPSGFAGGYVPDLMPQSYNEGIGLNMQQSDKIPPATDDIFLCLKKENDKFDNITRSLDNYKNKPGDYYIFKKIYNPRAGIYGGFCYTDLLKKGVTEKFLEITMSGYEKSIGNEFAKTVPGIFSDEPQIAVDGGIRWTSDLFDTFRKEHGYNLEEYLPALWDEWGDWKKIRHNYYQTLLHMFIERWSKPYSNYAQEKGLNWTGHYWEHDWPDLYNGCDNMAMYAWHQIPAIDLLFNEFNDVSSNAQFGNIRAVKELSSIANQLDKKRTLSETYGGGGWEETLKDFKRLGDWEYVLGVNMMNQHLSHPTLSGSRKIDYPPVFNDASPWWPYYKPLNEYFSRLSLALSSGEQVNDILVLEPTTSVWLYASKRKANQHQLTIGQKFQEFVTELEKHQVEYDLGCENIIKDQGEVNKKGFKIGSRIYNTIVIPPLTENIDTKTAYLLQKYIENGGKIIAYAIPERIDGNYAPELKKIFDAPSVKILKALTDNDIKKHFGSTEISFNDLSSENIYHHRRITQDGQILFIVNSSVNSNGTGSVSVKGKDIAQLDLYDGTVKEYNFYSDKNKIRFTFDLPPAGSLLLYVSDKKIKNKQQVKKIVTDKLIKTDTHMVVKRSDPNVLAIDYCDLKLNGEEFKDLYTADADRMIFKTMGFNDNPWMNSVQYKQNILRKNVSDLSGYEATYHFFVNDEIDTRNLFAVIERPELVKVSINGHNIKPEPDKWWLDRYFGVYPIGKYTNNGKNSISVSIDKMDVRAELDKIYIIGDFSVNPIEKGWEIMRPEKLIAGNWTKQGLPFYNSAVTYSRKYNIQDAEKNYAVSLDNFRGTVAEIIVNGSSAGTLISDPWKLDISSQIKPGENIITVKVISSLRNLLGPHHIGTSRGSVRPWFWRKSKPYPSGNEYDLLEYGIDGFDIWCN